MIEVALIFVFLVLTLIPVSLVIWLLVYCIRVAGVSVGSCARCGYDLRDLRERRQCPECGHPFRLDETGQAVSRARKPFPGEEDPS